MRIFFKKYLYSIICGFFGSFGLYCLIYLVSILNFHEISKHPCGYPISIILGLVSLLVCIITCIFNVTNLMNEQNIIKYIVCQLLITMISFVISFITFNTLGF